jgi:cystathionine beta-synthase
MQYIDAFTKVTDKDGAVMARRLAKEEGLFCGYSAGSCLQGVVQLMDQLKPDDVVVCIFHDHGSRYVGKVYNDEWMLERGFLDVRTFKDIINSRKSQKLIAIDPQTSVSDAIALMKKYDIENIPVFEQGNNVGSISESGLFNHILHNPDIKSRPVADIMENPYPEVAFHTPVEQLGQYIHKDNGAVLSKDDSGLYQIVTKYDILQSLSK